MTSDPNAVRERHRQVLLVVLIFQVAIAILISGQAYVLCQGLISWSTLALYYLTLKSLWIALLPLVLFLAQRFPIERSRWAASLPIHFVAASVLSLAVLIPNAAIDRQFRVYPPVIQGSFIEEYVHLVWSYFHEGVLVYFAIIGTELAFDYHQRYRDREIQAARLKEQLALAQLQALRAQLQPHFLFNTLNGIVGLIRSSDYSGAVQMTAQLSDLVRHVLDQSDKQEVPLRDEIETTRRYLEIQQMRFSDRLTVRMEIAPGDRESSTGARDPNPGWRRTRCSPERRNHAETQPRPPRASGNPAGENGIVGCASPHFSWLSSRNG